MELIFGIIIALIGLYGILAREFNISLFRGGRTFVLTGASAVIVSVIILVGAIIMIVSYVRDGSFNAAGVIIVFIGFIVAAFFIPLSKT